jgi:HAD superfamily hydrolase (TIGR01509 family)
LWDFPLPQLFQEKIMTLDISRIQALCFDVDGTLSDTDDQAVQKLARFLRPFFRDPQPPARRLVMWAEAPANAALGLADKVGFDDEFIALADFLNRHRKPSEREFLLIPGIREMLTRLQETYPLAVVSAREEKSTRAFLDTFGLTPFFQVVVTALTVEHTKPYPDPILYAAREMGVAPEHCLMIGDTTVDIRAGKAAGAQTVGVLCGFGEEEELRRAGADLILPSTADLADALLS